MSHRLIPVGKVELRGKRGAGKCAIVDLENLDTLSKYSWHVNRDGYAIRNKSTVVDGKRKTRIVFMHREVLGTPLGKQTDHINGDKLDNTAKNLRVCNHTENQRNCSANHNSESGFKGVSRHNGTKKWRARIRFNGKEILGGYFYSKEDAAIVYNGMARQYFGKFARLNEVKDVT